jgi:hypothetical protein
LCDVEPPLNVLSSYNFVGWIKQRSIK